jgi:hypothetical protein
MKPRSLVAEGIGKLEDKVGSADVRAVEATVADYFEGWFSGRGDRMEAALHPDLVKRSLNDDGSDLDRTQSAAEIIELTRAGRGTRFEADRRQFQTQVIDVYGGIATAVVRSPVYHEYLQLAHTDDGWKIVHALWVPSEGES